MFETTNQIWWFPYSPCMIYLPTFGSIHLDDVWGNKSMLDHGGYSSSMEQYFGYGSAKVSALRRLTSLSHLKLSLKPDPWHKPCGKLANFGGSVLSTRKINLHAQFPGVRSCPSKLPGNCEEILCRSLLSWMENSTTTKSHVTNGPS